MTVALHSREGTHRDHPTAEGTARTIFPSLPLRRLAGPSSGPISPITDPVAEARSLYAHPPNHRVVSSQSLQSVILGSSDADLVLTGGEVLSTTRRTLVDGALAIMDDRIAGIPSDPDAVVGPETTVIDVSGQVLAPGFIDAHTHLDLHQTIDRSYPETLAGGTTTLVSEVAAFGPAYGVEGVEAVLDSTADLPVRVLVTVPPQPLFDMFEPPAATGVDADDLVALLERERVVGVGETAWIRLVGRESGAAPLYSTAKDRGMTVSGHGAGVAGEKLQAFGMTVTDDHEAITAAGIHERVDAGIHPIGRHGSIRDDLDAFVDATAEIDSAEASLSTDGMWPRELVAEGHMDVVLARAIDRGIDPIDAIVMATRTPARHFGRDELGHLGPGTPADVVAIPELASPTPSLVVVDGEVVLEDGNSVPGGEASVTPEPVFHDYPDPMTSLPTMTIDESDFVVPSERVEGAVRAISVDGELLTGETTVRPPVEAGDRVADPAADVLKVSLFDRSPGGDRRGFTGFLQGFGMESGAVATTLTWETPGLLVVGAESEAMARAADRVLALDGGWAVVDDGQVIEEMATPIGATCAETPPAETAARYEAVEASVRGLGSTLERPLLRLQTLAFVGVPALKMRFGGYADIRNGRLVGLVPE